MDIQIEKSNITFNELLRESKVEQPVDSEIMLPDFCPDIARVLKCRATSKIMSKRMVNSQLNIDGTVVLTVLYVDNDGNIRSFEQMLSYYREIEIGESESIDSEICTKVDYINCRMLNPRKLEIHGAITLAVTISARRQCEVVTGASGAGVQLNTHMKQITNVQDKCEKYITVNDEIELDSESCSLRSILRSEGYVSGCSCQVVPGKAMIKGDLNLCIIYCTDVKMRLEKLETKIPFTQMLDMPLTDEQCYCNAVCDVAAIELHPRTGIDGEVKSISLSAGINITVTSGKNVDITVADDAYSVNYEIAVDKSQRKFRRRVNSFDGEYIYKNRLDLPREVISILDMWCVSSVSSVSAESDTVRIDGTMEIGILASDPDGMPLYFEKNAEYSFRQETACQNCGLECVPKVSVAKTGYALNGSTAVDINVSMAISYEMFDSIDSQVITEITVDESKIKPSAASAALTVYYAHNEELVFDIARKYNTTVSAVRAANSLEAERLDGDMMLLIPVVSG